MLNEIIQNILIPSNEYIFGFADLNGLLIKKFEGFNYGISIGKKLNYNIVESIKDGPTIEYYQHYNQINSELQVKAERIAEALQKIDVESLIIKPTVTSNIKDFDKDYPTLTFDLSHKMVATRAGLGWVGKTDLFISKKFGPRLRLTTILINKKPEADSIPIDKSRCGNCNICVDSCPANAANGMLWSISIYRDKFFNAHACKAQCEEFAKHRLNMDKLICGICVSACPIGRMIN